SLSMILILAGCKTNVEDTDHVSVGEMIPFNASQIDAHNCRNSLDWEGSYTGVLPCEECIGIDTFLKINRDHTYTATQRFVDSGDVAPEEITSEGTFFWNEEGCSISVEIILGELITFRLNELFLTPLITNGIEIRP